ncbi:MAG: ABC transporter substrate-binding protein [Planctomycetia bacterium]|nr:MAG: ABC transporter substrate-binding protein [Planctomycetia bacterium]RIK67169.1 MAG: hypothetical protein DCC66_12195 [Planctomycetota bacterium]
MRPRAHDCNRTARTLRVAAVLSLATLPVCDRSSDVAPPTSHATAHDPAATQPQTNSPRFRRIISISPDATEMIGALGAADRLVAVSSFCIDPPQVMKLPRIGGLFDVNLELVLRLQPDLIVLRGDHRAVQELCERNRIPIYRDRTNTFDDIFQTLGDLGELLDATDRAEQIAAAMHERLAKIESALAPLPRPRVFVTLSRNPDTLAAVMTAGQNTFVDEIIRRAGGINVFADASLDYPQVSPEAVLAARPDVIIECMPEVAITDALRDKVVKTWRPLAQLPAVASGRIHLLDLPHALIPSHRVVDTVAAVARILHPEAKLD